MGNPGPSAMEVSKIVAYVATKDARFARVNPDPRITNAIWAGSLPAEITLEEARQHIDAHYRARRWDGSMVEMITPDQLGRAWRAKRQNRERAQAARQPKRGVPMPEWFKQKWLPNTGA